MVGMFNGILKDSEKLSLTKSSSSISILLYEKITHSHRVRR